MLRFIFTIQLVLLLSLFFRPAVTAQELEPRLLTNLPVGTNFGVIGYGYAQGNILLDPAVPIEDLDARLHSLLAAYLRSVNIFGMSGKISGVLPYAIGNWDGYYNGVDTSTNRNGLGDPRINFAFNILGSPAMKLKDYKSYDQKTIVGVNFTIVIPLGQYDPDKLINLGSNRWGFKAEAGFSQKLKKWFLEVQGAVWYFTVNQSFFPDNTLEQKPFLAGKVHAIRSLPKNMWFSLSAGYGMGGRTVLNGEERDTRMSTLRFGLTYVYPIADHHSLKLFLHSGVRLDRGPDFDSMVISYQYRWFNKQ